MTTPNPLTLDDALRALARYTDDENVDNLAIVEDFLNHLAKLAAPETAIETDRDGYIIEGAMQHGFEFIDDNADLLVVHCNDLIKYVKLYRDFKPAEQWVLSYPRKERTQYVGPFPSKQAAFDFPIEPDVCSVSRLYTPEQDMEYDD